MCALSFEAIIAEERKNLLDPTRRNRLIHTPRGAGRTSRLDVVDERSDQVFDLLVRQGKKMSFLPVPDEQGRDDEFTEADEFDLLGQPESDDELDPNRHADDRLQTNLTSEKLQKRLLKLFYDARTYEEEQGVNLLFLALGFLKYYDDPRTKQESFGPLLLIPVELSRRSASSPFKLAWNQDDLVTNLSLQEKLKTNCDVALPDLPEGEDWAPSAYFDQVRVAVAKQPRFEVLQNDMTLWFFTFSKFLMYRDLDPAVWPEDRPLPERRLLNSLLSDGFGSESLPRCGDDQPLDEVLDPADMAHVVDADSSQAVVIEEVRSGADLVIQGPPGTGKSQTITNIIAAAVMDGKRVLFVSEKMAALEVVRRRLANIGLGDMCLELHSNKANKRSVLDDLARTLKLGRPKTDGVDDHVAKLRACRDQLNEYVNDLHAKICASGLSTYQVLGRLVELRRQGSPPPPFQLPEATAWTLQSYDDLRGRVDDLAKHVQRLGNPTDHPWRGVQAETVLPNDVQLLLQKLEPLENWIGELQDAIAQLARAMGVDAPGTPVRAAELAKAANRIRTIPSIERPRLADQVWTDRKADIEQLVADGAQLAEQSAALAEVFDETAWDVAPAQIAQIRQTLKGSGRSWFRFFNKKYRAATADFIGLLRGDPPKKVADRIALVDRLHLAKRQKDEITGAGGEALGTAAFGMLWRGVDSDWNALRTVCEWVGGCQNGISEFDVCRLAAQTGDLAALDEPLQVVRHRLNPLVKTLADAVKPLQLDLRASLNAKSFADAPLASLAARISTWRQHPEAMAEWTGYFLRLRRLLDVKLTEVARLMDQGQLDPQQARGQFVVAYCESLLRHVLHERPQLAAFSGMNHDQLRSTFCALDEERLRLARQEVAAAHHALIPQHAAAAGEFAVIHREINKKRCNLPIRRLLAEAGRAVQQLKPVFMMSPSSVAQFLEPGGIEFDLLVIDEASQVEPVDAFGAMARAQQIAVVGDDRQLPPTRFFAAAVADGDGQDDGDGIQAADVDSILELCRAKGVRQQMLRWHYRSRHHSLIAVSNHEFYDDGLFVIPSPANGDATGLRFRHIANGVFDRGRSATNRIEAAAVADAVIQHAVEHPGKSLGVGAFSVAQRDAILDELELRRRQRPEVESFFNTGVAEPFFVKNLENIQGDERDVIFISIGYARDESGFIGMNFGPLSNDGGERRLNVLISRAKERCEVFSSILSDDIDLNRTKSRGAKALKSFLKYAQHGELDVPAATDRGFDSEFERSVSRSLTDLGYEVDAQVGTAGFFVDLAIVDPDAPGRYLLGIECDGASYHSARWARDRDRLRQQVLEDRGWIIHRIWSTDWFHQPEAQLRRVVAAIEAAKAEWGSRVAAAATDTELPVDEEEDDGGEPEILAIARHEADDDDADQQPLAVPYREAWFRVDGHREIHELSLRELLRVVTKIVEIEGPVHQDEIARRTATLWGAKRTGSRIVDAVERALAESVHRGAIAQHGLFFTAPDQKSVPMRDRTDVESKNLLKPDYLPPAEIAAAARAVVERNLGLTADEAATEVGRLLGFRRIGAPLKQVLLDEINLLVAEDVFAISDGKLYPPSGQDERTNSLRNA